MRKVILKFILVGFFIFGVLKYGISNSFSDDIVKTAEDYFLEGKEFMERGEYEKANEFFKKAQYLIKEDTNKKQSKPKDEQEVSCHSVNEKYTDGRDYKTIFKKAKKAYLNKEWDTALKLYTWGLSKFENNSDIHYNLGVIFLRKLDYFNAAKHFEEAASLNYKDTGAYYNLGILYEKYLDNTKKARIYYRKYLRFVLNKEEKIKVEKWIGFMEKYGKIR